MSTMNTFTTIQPIIKLHEPWLSQMRRMQDLEVRYSGAVRELKEQYAEARERHLEHCNLCTDDEPCAEAQEMFRRYYAKLAQLTHLRMATLREQSMILRIVHCASRYPQCGLSRRYTSPDACWMNCEFLQEMQRPYIERILQLRREDLGETLPTDDAESTAHWGAKDAPLMIAHI